MTTSESQVPFPVAPPPQPLGAPVSFVRRSPRRLPGRPGKKTAVLLLYTGGTIGMRKDEKTGAFVPDVGFLEDSLARGLLPDDDAMPALSFSAFDPPLDSGDMSQAHWTAVARAIGEEYERYDGFVVVHGTDTMAYTASAVSFALEGLAKPVVFTGSQIPLSVVRTDGLTNLVDSCLVAGTAGPAIAEVLIVFDSLVMRGNRTTKLKAWGISGFKSFNFPPIGEGGVHLISFDSRAIAARPGAVFRCKPDFSPNVALLSVFPGCERFATAMLGALVRDGVRGIVLEAYGIGNAPSYQSLISAISSASDVGVVILVVSKCPSGGVSLGSYAGGYGLGVAGCVSGYDMMTEAAFAKLSWLLADKSLSLKDVRRMCEEDLRGEVTPGFLIHHNKEHRVLV